MKFVFVGTDFHLGKEEGVNSNDTGTPYAIKEFDSIEQAIAELDKSNWVYVNHDEPNVFAFKVQTVLLYDDFYNRSRENK